MGGRIMGSDHAKPLIYKQKTINRAKLPPANPLIYKQKGSGKILFYPLKMMFLTVGMSIFMVFLDVHD